MHFSARAAKGQSALHADRYLAQRAASARCIQYPSASYAAQPGPTAKRRLRAT